MLNDLDQGVVILKEESKAIIFANKAAKKLPINLCQNLDKFVIDIFEPLYAKLDQQLFKKGNADIAATV